MSRLDAPVTALSGVGPAIAEKLERDCGLRYDPATELMVTSGISGAFAAAMMALFTRGAVTILKQDEATKKFERQLEKSVDLSDDQPALLAIGGNTLVVLDDQGNVQIRDIDTLKLRKQLRPEGNNQPKFVKGMGEKNKVC